MNEDTQPVAQPEATPPATEGTPAPTTPEQPTEPAKSTPVLMKKIDALMGMSVIGISLAATLLAMAIFANPYV